MLKIVKSNHLLNLGMVLLILVSSVSCIKDSTEDPLLKYEIALDAFVAKLVANPPDSTDLDRRIKEYLLAQNNDFFGSTVTLLGKDGKATYSPYYYRLNNTLSYKNLLVAGYQIDEQSWLRLPIQKGYAIWTPPYFDEGGGDIWMRTLSVPIYINSVIFAVATTDIEVEKP
jgi:sigma-B regulation protein RsbU (phosphoserine phosphatase)